MSRTNPGSVGDTLAVAEFFTGVRHHGQIAEVTHINLPGNRPPWQSSGLQLRRGQAYSLFSEGVIRWSRRHPHLYGGPRFHLWARIHPGGRAVNLSANTDTFIADRVGTLELGIYMGMWADEFGALASAPELYAALDGALGVALVVYAGDPLTILNRLSEHGPIPALVADEAHRLSHPQTPPAGWRYLHEIGHADMYREERTAAGTVVHAHARDDQGILRRAVDFPLTAATKVEWRWRVDEHPSRDPENRAIDHDYVSLATEFDNGRDLTWIWSSSLEPGVHFPCPIKVWQTRETHYVIRSQRDRLSQWYRESRNVYDDVTEAMGPPPKRITAVWLIAVSSFHHRVARASFSDIALVDDQRRLIVL